MKKKKRVAVMILFLLGAVLLLIGIVMGGYESTLSKGIFICLECIGIG